MSENTIADLLRQLDSEEGAIAECTVRPNGSSDYWNITVTRPEAARVEGDVLEPLSEGDCLSYLYHLIGMIEAKEKRITSLVFDLYEVEITQPEDKFRKYAMDGVQKWTFTIEPWNGRTLFTKQG